MKVKALRNIKGVGGETVAAGEEIEAPDNYVQLWLGAGAVEVIEAKKRRGRPPKETAEPDNAVAEGADAA